MELTPLPPTGIPSNGLIPWILWSLWIARNNLLFNKKTATPEEVVTKAIASAREWLDAQVSVPVAKRSKPEICQSLANCFKLQTDAAWREDAEAAGLGWCVRKPLIAEALAMREAIYTQM